MFPSLLPTSLLALVFASPVLGAPSSSNDPFREIALQAPKREKPPICCLRPLEPAEPSAGDDVFISFEDWKARRLGEARESPARSSPAANTAQRSAGGKERNDVDGQDKAASSSRVFGVVQPSGLQDSADVSHHDERLAPQLRIPIVDRFNYAATDCSARVHTAHRSAKSPSSILSSKKDRYLLSPCAEEKQFVVVELCDDIMIDTVQMANYEFFSGVFKDFSVSVAKTPPTDEQGWTHAGTYRAQNVRGVQSFHPPPTLRDFYRFIRIDFHSHYGNEYYCPLSLLRVYGLTHLEQWKWDEWEQQSRARRASDASAAADSHPEPPQTAHIPVADVSKPQSVETEAAMKGSTRVASETEHAADEDGASSVSSREPSVQIPSGPHTLEEPQPTQDAAPVSDTAASIPPTTPADTTTPDMSTTPDDLDNVSHESQTAHPADSDSAKATTPSWAISTSLSSDHYPPSYHNRPPHEGTSSGPVESAHASQSRVASIASNLSSSVSSSVSLAASQSHSPPPSPPVVFPPASTGGESIYRTIMNRLSVLEANTTLYARYVEEQTAGIREVLLRLGEDLGRLEGIGKAQAQMYQRSVTEFDKQRRKLEWEHRELLVKVNHLTEEVVLEKRLGILQLCLLLAVLVFMALTRGSRGEHASVHRVPDAGRPMGMREWGRRTLSLSGDWVNRFRSRSPTPKPVSRPESRQTDKNPAEQVDFPSQSTQTPSHRPFLSTSPRSPTFSHPRSATRHLSSRPRTPSSLRVSTPRYHNLHARSTQTTSTPPPSARPQMTRSTSSSAGFGSGFGTTAIESVPRSAKRWARSAHLHEVKSTSGVQSRAPDSARMGAEETLGTVRETESAESSRTVLVSEGATPAVDVFSPRPEAPPTPTASKGKGKQLRPTLSPLAPFGTQ
ncbi:hypothetical protein EVJ58_g3013 [Rhodofomes roseus]|uniref:SUN domain-containing protein n=1 Tax=Rhodofomes roseus TaxID=34475 RepID=A0A4Y9YPY3_9APHY|nr:hypothetical protein EVJ58_g3013 [Rhodofomes roseus]